MNVYLMKAQFFQMVGPTCSSPEGFGVSSSGSDVPPLPPRTMVEAFMAFARGSLTSTPAPARGYEHLML
jgi:hypothetical protein